MKKQRDGYSLDPSGIQFSNRTFCFTGKLADLTRSLAAEAVRARGGFSVNSVGDSLSYLVIGSIPSTGWKHGNYGRKIEKAMELRCGSGKLQIVPEDVFMNALMMTAVTNSGAIDAKVLVCNYEFYVESRDSFDGQVLEQVLRDYRERTSAHISVRAFPVAARRRMFDDERLEEIPDRWVIILCRAMLQQPLECAAAPVAAELEDSLRGVEGAEDGHFSFFERREGTATYAKLLLEVPEELRIAGL